MHGGVVDRRGQPVHRRRPTYAWPTNEIAVMGRPRRGRNVIFRRQIADAEDPEAMRARMVWRVQGRADAPLLRGRARPGRRRHRPGGDPRSPHPLLAMLPTKHADLPSRKHGNPPQ
ncbi:hypothetical protein LV779_36970 [Streptomyces thinghirensis]|nr:hypothetical protein [Streptomyces thinghirensis]